jgi:hypothetical protein
MTRDEAFQIICDALGKVQTQCAYFIAPGPRNSEATMRHIIAIVDAQEVVQAMIAVGCMPKKPAVQ